MSTITVSLEPQLFGYVRSSKIEQNNEYQIDAITNYCKNYFKDKKIKIYIEKQSGKNLERKEYQKLRKELKQNDILVFYDLSRISRSLQDLSNEFSYFKSKKIQIHSLKEKIDLNSATGMLIVHILSAIAQFNRELLRENIIAGLQIAKKTKRLGKPYGKTNEENIRLKELIKLKYQTQSIYSLNKQYKVSRSTIYKWLKQMNIPLKSELNANNS